MSDGRGRLRIMKLKYKSGYKYQVVEDFYYFIAMEEDIKTRFIELDIHGTLTIRAGYAFDGASGPTWDSKETMKASLVHDALYQLMREGHLSQDCRKATDALLRDIGIQEGMWKIRAWTWYYGVRAFAGGAARGVREVKEV